MAYTNNVPQGNQQIATTQPIIQANFGFIQTGISQEHNFNASGSGTDMYHLKASMPNLALSPALPASTNGVYFVNAGAAYFYDGTTNWNLNQWQGFLTGSYTPSSSSSFNTVVNVPANTIGMIILYRANAAGYVQTGFYVASGTRCFAYANRMKINGTSDDYPVQFNNASASLALQGQAFSGSYTGIAYTYKIFYRPA